MKNTLQILALEGGVIAIPESQIDEKFSEAFLKENERRGLLTVNNDGPHGMSVIIELTAKGREMAGLPAKVSLWRSLLNLLFPTLPGARPLP